MAKTTMRLLPNALKRKKGALLDEALGRIIERNQSRFVTPIEIKDDVSGQGSYRRLLAGANRDTMLTVDILYLRQEALPAHLEVWIYDPQMEEVAIEEINKYADTVGIPEVLFHIVN